MRLKDRVAVVTGGGGGIGKGICLCLAREGAHVVVSDQNRTLAERVAAEIIGNGAEGLRRSNGRAKRERVPGAD